MTYLVIRGYCDGYRTYNVTIHAYHSLDQARHHVKSNGTGSHVKIAEVLESYHPETKLVLDKQYQ